VLRRLRLGEDGAPQWNPSRSWLVEALLDGACAIADELGMAAVTRRAERLWR